MGAAFKLTIDPGGIARLVFDLQNEKVNKFSPEVVDELEEVIDGIKGNTYIKALVITSGKEGIFIAGADLKCFEGAFEDPSIAERLIKKGHKVFNKLSELPFPSIAVINGGCFGGGTEFALACTYRIATDHPKTQIGLPEVNLGIFPGWGGTKRMPELVGLIEGLTLVCSGKAVNAKKAYKIHLADAIIPYEFADKKIDAFVENVLTPNGKKEVLERRKRKGLRNWLLEKNPIGRAIVYSMTKKNILKKTKGQYPAPIAALDLIKKSYTMSLKRGLEMEIKEFVRCTKKEFRYAPNLIHLFFMQEGLKKDPGVPEGATPHTVHQAAVIGAGTMGSGIAWLFSYRDIPVRMKDINWKAVGKGFGSAWDTYKTLMKIRKLKPFQANNKFHLISGTTDYSGFHHADLVVEAAVENMELKHKILAELEEAVRDDCIIGTNTSSLTVSAMATVMKRPERLVGMHFFNPPSRMPLVEIVQGEKTSPEAVATAVELCKRLRKTPIVVGDCPGFLVNRVFVLGMFEIMHLLEEGVEMARLEKVMLKFGMPMGPFNLADVVGIDVNYKVAKSFQEAYGERMAVPKILEEMFNHELYGEKTGKGFYIYEGKKKTPNPEVLKLIPSPNPHKLEISDEGIVHRVILNMVNEATRCLEEKIVTQVPHLDMALILGTGFPPFRGGLLRYADTIGTATILEELKALEQKYGSRYTSSDYLEEMARANKKFYE